MKEKTLWICVGIPGSGKSTWCAKQQEDMMHYVSRDAIRFSMLNNEDEYFANEKKVYKLFVAEIQKWLDAGESVIADATHINWASRNKLIKSLHLDDVKVNCLVFKTPVNICQERNANRDGRAKVPASIITMMNNNMTHPRTDPYTYNQIYNIYLISDEQVIVI